MKLDEIKFIDIGANLTDPMFQGIYHNKSYHNKDLENVIERATSIGLETVIVTVGQVQQIHVAKELCQQFPLLRMTVGVHPTNCNELESGDSSLLTVLKESLSLPWVVALGEFGLDYDRLEFCSREIQLKWFEWQLRNLAGTKPLFLHCRNSFKDMLELLSRFPDACKLGGVVHSFDGDLLSAKAFLSLGLDIGINGCSLKTADNLQVVKEIPLERMHLETDAPWCDIRPSHAGHRFIEPIFRSVKKEKHEFSCLVKGRNEPCSILNVLQVISKVKEIPLKTIADTIYNNSKRLFMK